MLKLVIPDRDWFDDDKELFIPVPGGTLLLEHSLISISKWESKHHKAFLESFGSLSPDEIFDYIRCMSISKDTNPSIFDSLTSEEMQKIDSYMNNPMTATRFYEDDSRGSKSGIHDKMTSELIYYWMISYNIPVEFERWHINRLLTLIKVFNMKNQDPKKSKLSTDEIRRRNSKLNAQRRAAMKHHG